MCCRNMSTRKFFTGDATALNEFCGDSVFSVGSARDVFCRITKELQYQRVYAEFLQKRKSSLAGNNDVIGKELAILSAETRTIVDLNERMKNLSEQLRQKENEVKRLTAEDSDARDARPSVQQMFAEDLAAIQVRLDAHGAKSKALIDENNALRAEFRDILKAHDESDQVVVERLKLVDELYNQAILKQQNFTLRRQKQGEISALYLEDIAKYQSNEKSMKLQLDEFNKRFTEFEGELNQSSAIFATYKKKMDDMQAVIAGLEEDKVGLAAAYSNAVLGMRKIDEDGGAVIVENAKKLNKQIASLDKLVATLEQQKAQCLSEIAHADLTAPEAVESDNSA